jgi:HD-GYP domain-containing protein (c-di-GMP phosphodiesterase class II)
MGHSRGDALLYACAQVLRLSLRRSDILARIGGDEFAALLPRTGETVGAKIAMRIQANMDLHNKIRPELPLSISVGTATAEKEDTPLTEIYKKADDYMYRNKFSNRSSVRSYIVDILLAALAERDRISQGHAERLAALCLKMGKKLQLPPSRLAYLDLLARVHDLGNVGVPDAILFKETSLTGEEWELMRQHPEKGYRIARFSPKLKRVAELILQHHERWDGKGYPRGLRGEAIALECRIFAIADAYEAMTSDGRAYREARGKGAALIEIEKHAGSQFDPRLVEIFCALT